jgi:hypothetical protein
MLTRSMTVVIGVTAAILLGSAISTTMFFSRQINSKAQREAVKRLTTPFGRVDLALPQMTATSATEPMPPGDGIYGVSGEYTWRTKEVQEAFAKPIVLRVLWSDNPPPAWRSEGQLCGYLLDAFGSRDGLVGVPGLTTLSYKDMHVCQVVSFAEQRQYLYTFAIPKPSCTTGGVVFARIPWLFADDSTDAVTMANAIIDAHKASAFNLLGSYPSIQASAACGASMRHAGWSVGAAFVGLLVGTLGLCLAVRRRTASLSSYNDAG